MRGDRSSIWGEVSVEQLAMLEQTMPTEEVLRWMVTNEYMLVQTTGDNVPAGYPREKLELFYSKGNDVWCNAEEQKFSRDDKVGTGWLGLRKT